MPTPDPLRQRMREVFTPPLNILAILKTQESTERADEAFGRLRARCGEPAIGVGATGVGPAISCKVEAGFRAKDAEVAAAKGQDSRDGASPCEASPSCRRTLPDLQKAGKAWRNLFAGASRRTA